MSERWRSRVRLADEVAEELRTRIYRGDYPLGARLRQEQLAAELDVSRTPLREALRMLESEGLVVGDRGAGAGMRVISKDPERLLDAYRVREVVDGLAARLAADAGDPALDEWLAGAIEQQAAALEAWEPGGWPHANEAFHSQLIEASGNVYLIRQLPLVRLTSHVFAPIGVLDRSRATSAYREHQSIARAVADREPDAAEELARAHIRSTIHLLREQVRE